MTATATMETESTMEETATVTMETESTMEETATVTMEDTATVTMEDTATATMKETPTSPSKATATAMATMETESTIEETATVTLGESTTATTVPGLSNAISTESTTERTVTVVENQLDDAISSRNYHKSCSSSIEVQNWDHFEREEIWRQMQFQTPKELEEFYKSYAHQKGFGVRCKYQKKRMINGEEMVFYVKLVCNKEGFRKPSKKPKEENARPYTQKETRVGCMAMIYFKYSLEQGAFLIDKWVLEHNDHVLHSADCSHMHRSNRSISSLHQHLAQMNTDAGISLRSSYELMALNAGGREHLGFLHSDLKNHLGKQRQRSMKHGEATALLEYFRMRACDEPLFFHEVEVDSEERIANIFWADRRMRSDYNYFGDAICFDTTFRTNRNYRPLGLFVGYDNHRMSCVFGAALLFDETTDSFRWLFKTFLRCMDGKAPKTIFTDQDQAIANAINEEFQSTYHCLCTWHILENAKKNLSRLYTPKVADWFHYLIKEVDNHEEFSQAWNLMLQDCFDNNEHKWLKGIYKLRTKWSSAWVKQQFTAGMVTTQVAESFNSIIKRYLQPDHNFLQFFTHFNNLLDGRRYETKKADFQSKDKLRNNKNRLNTLLNSAEIYTHYVYDQFQVEYDAATEYRMDLQMDNNNPTDHIRHYKVYKYANKDTSARLDERVVQIHRANKLLLCSCRSLETTGLFCRHVLRVIDTLRSLGEEEFQELPQHYILKRWTVLARDAIDSSSLTVTSGSASDIKRRVNKIKCDLLDLVDEASLDQGKILLLEDLVVDARNKIRQSQMQSNKVNDDVHRSSSHQVATAIKIRDNPRAARRRWKSANEQGRLNKKRKCNRMAIDLNNPAQSEDA